MVLRNKLNLCLLLFFSSVSIAAASQTRVLQLNAHIDNEKFFSYQVTKFGFDESNLIVDYNRSAERFYSQSTNVVLETDIPVGFSAGFELISKDLTSTCEDSAGEIVQKDFASYWIEGEVLSESNSVHFDSFNNANSLYLNDKREFTVNFDSTSGLDVKKAYCKGSATLVVSLDF